MDKPAPDRSSRHRPDQEGSGDTPEHTRLAQADQGNGLGGVGGRM
jgi:hypothetical protein